MVARTRTQKGRKVAFNILPGADHFFEEHMEAFIQMSEGYLDERLAYHEPEGPYFE